MDELNAWRWPSRPTTEAEFDEMMMSLDRHLASRKLLPFQRGLHALSHVSWSLQLDGTPILGGNHDRGAPFSPTDLLARVHDWYQEHYADAMRLDMSPGSIVLVIHNNLWKLWIPKVWGTVTTFADRNLSNKGVEVGVRTPATYNCLCSVAGLTQAFASKFSDEEVRFIHEAFQHGLQAMSGLESLAGHSLFEQARADYRHSVNALISGVEFGKARWETAQCAEKILKGMLAMRSLTFPTTAGKGHDHIYLGELVREKIGIDFDSTALSTLKTSAAVRYGEVASSLSEAMDSHAALLYMLTMVEHHRRQRP